MRVSEDGLRAYIRPVGERLMCALALMGIRARGPYLKSGHEGHACYQVLPTPGPTGRSITDYLVRNHRVRVEIFSGCLRQRCLEVLLSGE